MVRVDVFVSLHWRLEKPTSPKKWSNVLSKQFFAVSSENTAFPERIVNTEHLIRDKKRHIHFWRKIIYSNFSSFQFWENFLKNLLKILINCLEIGLNFDNNYLSEIFSTIFNIFFENSSNFIQVYFNFLINFIQDSSKVL